MGVFLIVVVLEFLLGFGFGLVWFCDVGLWFSVIWCWSFPYEMDYFLDSARIWWLLLISKLEGG